MKLFQLGIWICSLFVFVGCATKQENFESIAAHSENQPAITITDFSDRTISLQQPPENIVALGNGETDIIYALGGEVVGRPTGEAMIQEAEEALEVGSTHSVDLEKITYLQPDIVLGNFPMNQKDIEPMKSIGAELILTSANSVEDIIDQIALFGSLLDKQDRAIELISEIKHKVSELENRSIGEKPRILLIYGAPGTNMIALPNSLGGNILELAGGINIASDYPSLDMYPQYAQLNTERIIEANPQIILLMSHGNPEEVKDSFIQDMEKAAGWSQLDAVKNDQFHILPSELFGTNPGTRVIDALNYMYDLLEDVNE